MLSLWCENLLARNVRQKATGGTLARLKANGFGWSLRMTTRIW